MKKPMPPIKLVKGPSGKLVAQPPSLTIPVPGVKPSGNGQGPAGATGGATRTKGHQSGGISSQTQAKIVGGAAMWAVGAIVMLVFWYGYSSFSASHQRTLKEVQDAVEACRQRGIRYYRDIGSYPVLHSTGRLAEQQVADICGRSSASFGWME